MRRGTRGIYESGVFNFECDALCLLCCRKHILTGSFDKTARVWSTETGECLQTLWGHSAEVASAKFDPSNQLIATASMDFTARIYSTLSGN